MRILLVTDWNRLHGGAENHIAALRQGLTERGDDVRLLTSSAGSAADGTADFVAFGTEARWAQVFLQIANPSAAAQVSRAVRDFRPDVACVNMFALHLSPAAVFALRDVPVVLLVSDYKCLCPIGSKVLPDGSLCRSDHGWVCYRSGCVGLAHWARDRVRYELLRRAVERADRVVTVSDAMRTDLLHAGIDATVIPPPVAPPATGYIRAPDGPPVFLYAGRLSDEKGVPLLLHTFARLAREIPEIRLRIAGRGAEEDRLHRLCRDLGISSSVDFLGWLSPSELEEQLRTVRACVVPSLWAEPLGLIAVEAILHGTPVIASSAGGLGEVVEPGVTGLLFPNNDAEALTDCLRAVATGSAFPDHRIGADAIARATQAFGLASHIERMREVFADAIARRSNASREKA